MSFLRIDIGQWERKEYGLHFIRDVVCTYSINAARFLETLQEKIHHF